MADDIEFLVPQQRVLVIDGVSLTITPLVVSELPGVIRAVEPLLGTLIYEGESLDPVRVVALLGQHGEAIAEAVAICCRREAAWVGGLLPDRMAALTLVCVEVNADFFSKALAALRAQAPKLAPSLAAKIMSGQFLPGTKRSTA